MQTTTLLNVSCDTCDYIDKYVMKVLNVLTSSDVSGRSPRNSFIFLFIFISTCHRNVAISLESCFYLKAVQPGPVIV